MRRTVGTALILSGIAFALAWPTNAFGYGSTNMTALSITASIVDPCGSASATGNGFQAGEPATLTLSGVSQTLATTTVGTTGSFTTSFTIPQGTEPGTYTLTASGSQGDSASTGITVGNGGCSLSVATVTPNPGLAFTGADIAAVTGAGVIAVGAGAALVLLSRRRRQSPTS
jgi:hypothetical protein